jgi:5-methylcytosine-specific restriction endonuclease McrA
MENGKSIFNRAIRQVRVHLQDVLKVDNPQKSSIQRFAKLKYGIIISRKKGRKWLIEIARAGDLKGWPISTEKTKAWRKTRLKRKENNLLEVIGYENFLKTSYWRNVRKLVLDRDGHKCTKCNSEEILHIHHLTYKNHFNELEHLEDLITLCKKCHRALHKKK